MIGYRDAMRWSMGVQGLTTHQKAVLNHLAYRARQPQNQAWPTLAGIALDTSMSKRQVRRCLRALEQLGLIWAIGSGGKYRQTVYQLAGAGEMIEGGDRDTGRWKTVHWRRRGGDTQSGGGGHTVPPGGTTSPPTTTISTTISTTTPPAPPGRGAGAGGSS